MNVLKNILQPNIFEKIDKAGIATQRQILSLSVYDIKKLTNLTSEDICFLKNIVSNYSKPPSSTCDTLFKFQDTGRVTTGCKNVDELLRGGFKTGTITEIYGESGSGKTQLAISTAVNTSPNYCVYICTEDLFPVKRLNQIKCSHLQCDNEHGDHIFVEHLTESLELSSCIRVRLPKLLEKYQVAAIIIDSIAAPFRVESENYVKRAEDIRNSAIMLISLAQKYNLAIICINQVTASIDGNLNVLPSLGLAWSNMVTYRLRLRKLDNDSQYNIFLQNQPKFSHCNTQIRELYVMFAPDLPKSSTKFIITSDGVLGLPI